MTKARVQAVGDTGELEQPLEVPGSPGLAVIPNVPLVTVGEWAASTGPFDVTLERCLDAVAAQDDPGIIRPRVWPGHRPEELRQGEPALGIIQAMRWSAEDLTVYGDVLTLKALADAAPVMFPNRSIEAWTPFKSSATGREYAMVIDGLALLGIEWPAVPVLEDLTRLAGGDLGVLTVTEAERVAATANLDAGACRVVAAGSWTTTRKDEGMSERVRAQVEMDLVWREFYAQHEDEHPWWWIRADLVDPLALVIDMGEQGLATMAVTVSGDEVTFGDAIPVAVQYVPKGSGDAAQVAASFGKPSRVTATHDNAEATRLRMTTGDDVDVNALRAALGDNIAADASDEDVVAAAAALLGAGGDPDTDGGGGDGDEETPEGDETPTETPQPVTASGVPDGTVLVDEAAFEALKADAAKGRQAAERLEEQDREQVLATALREGRIARHEASVKTWRSKLAADFAGTRELLGTLAPGSAAPVDGERGHGVDPGAGGGDGLTHEQVMAAAWPQVAGKAGGRTSIPTATDNPSTTA